MNRLIFFISMLLISMKICFSQDCGTLGEKCSDTNECCGGCCIANICTQTYDNCQLMENPCKYEYCPPGFECYLFKPSKFCIGCGLQRACRPFKEYDQENLKIQ